MGSYCNGCSVTVFTESFTDFDRCSHTNKANTPVDKWSFTKPVKGDNLYSMTPRP